MSCAVFREADITRAFRAARKAGIAHPRVDIDTATGRISIVPCRAAADPDETSNPIDKLFDL